MPALRHASLFLLVVGMAGACASGCARQEAEGPPAPRTMRVGVGVPAMPTPGSGVGHVVSSMTTESWLTTQADGRLAERVVREWTSDPSGTRLRLRLRDDLRFHDGTLLTPEIAAAAIREMVADGRYASFSSIASVQAAEDGAVELRLSEPNSFLLPDLALTSVTLPGRPSMGTGPFQIVSQDPEHAVLRAFAAYYRGRPALDEMVISKYPTQRNAWAALLRNEIDLLYDISGEAVDFVRAENAVKSYSFPRPYSNVLVFNVRHPILKNAVVRRAINEAMDKAALVSDGLRGRGRPADGPLIPEHWAYPSSTEPFVFNPAAAAAKLDAMGLKVRPARGGRMPSRFSFKCLALIEDPRFERLALLVQKQLGDIGVDMILEPVPIKQLGARMKKGDFDSFLLETAGRSLTWAYDIWHSRGGGNVDSGYTAADAVLDRIRLARSDDEIKAGVVELIRIVHDDPPAAFLAWQETNRAVSRKFDLGDEDGRDIVTHAWRWRLAERPKP